MMLFYNLWYKAFGDEDYKVYKAFQNLAIVWMPSNWRLMSYAFDEGGTRVGGEKGVLISGLAHEGAVIFVSKGSGKIWETSFVHELTHIALEASTGSADADHLGSKYPGWTKDHSELIGITNALIEYVYTNEDETIASDLIKSIEE